VGAVRSYDAVGLVLLVIILVVVVLILFGVGL
jgi:hypothetical protein